MVIIKGLTSHIGVSPCFMYTPRATTWPPSGHHLATSKKAEPAAGFLRGQVMKLSGGRADPKIVGKLLKAKLDERRGR